MTSAGRAPVALSHQRRTGETDGTAANNNNTLRVCLLTKSRCARVVRPGVGAGGAGDLAVKERRQLIGRGRRRVSPRPDRHL